jgi:hypothetical protein
MNPRPLLAALTLVTACVAPPSRQELLSSSRTRSAEHDCCLHSGSSEPWGHLGRRAPAAARVEPEIVAPEPRAPQVGPDEFARLTQELQDARRALEVTRRELNEARRSCGEHANRLAELEAEVARRVEESHDLAARLVQAQVRRLEAERLVIERELAAERASVGRPASAVPR